LPAERQPAAGALALDQLELADLLLPTRRGFIDFGSFEATGNVVAVSVGANAALIREWLEIGAVYSTLVASQHNFDANGLLVKMTLRYQAVSINASMARRIGSGNVGQASRRRAKTGSEIAVAPESAPPVWKGAAFSAKPRSVRLPPSLLSRQGVRNTPARRVAIRPGAEGNPRGV
jgi:hypothetical protein